MDLKQIPDFSAYFISSDGQVFNKRGRKLSTYNCNGYRRLSLKGDDRRRRGVDVHRLVAAAWIGKIPSGYWVNHENGIKDDNRVENLRIDTPSYNHKHAFDTLGRSAGGSKPERSEAMYILAQAGWTHRRIAKLFQCSQANVSKSISRRRKQRIN